MQETIDVSDLDLLHAPADWTDTPITTELRDGHLLVGYLVLDEDARNPFEDGCGMGEITENSDDLIEALLLDQYDSPDIDPFMAAAEKKLRYLVRQNDLICLSTEVDRRVEALEDRDEQLEKIALKLREAAGFDPMIVFLRGWDNSNYQLEDDTDRVNALWRPDRCCEEHLLTFPEEKRRAEAIRCAESAIEQYQLYCEGENYGVVTEIFDKHGNSIHADEACWGFLGLDSAKQELAERMKHEEESFRQPEQPEDPNQRLSALNDQQQLKLNLI